MTDLKFCFPEDVPLQIASLDGKVSQMGVGKTGKVGFLKLVLEHDSQRSKTIVTEQRTQVPLYVQKALHYDCLLYTSPSPRDRTRSRMPSSA